MNWRVPLALAIGLTACSQIPGTAPSPSPSAPAPAPAPAPVTVKHPAAAPPARPVAKPSATADELVGLDEGEVRKRLGTPAEARDEGPARILAYKGHGCALDVILLMDVKAGTLRVATYEVDGAKPAGSCYSELKSPP